MKKKIVSAVMAASLAVLTAFPVLAGNGHPDGLQYKTSGTFLAYKGDPNF